MIVVMCSFLGNTSLSELYAPKICLHDLMLLVLSKLCHISEFQIFHVNNNNNNFILTPDSEVKLRSVVFTITITYSKT